MMNKVLDNPIAENAENPFGDVSPNHWAYNQIMTAVQGKQRTVFPRRGGHWPPIEENTKSATDDRPYEIRSLRKGVTK